MCMLVECYGLCTQVNWIIRNSNIIVLFLRFCSLNENHSMLNEFLVKLDSEFIRFFHWLESSLILVTILIWCWESCTVKTVVTWPKIIFIETGFKLAPYNQLFMLLIVWIHRKLAFLLHVKNNRQRFLATSVIVCLNSIKLLRRSFRHENCRKIWR